MRSYANALLSHALFQNDPNNLNAAIDIHAAALQLLTPKHAAYPALMGSLAKAFHARYRNTNIMDDLDKAIDNFKNTAEYTPFTDPNHTRSLAPACYTHTTDLLGKTSRSLL